MPEQSGIVRVNNRSLRPAEAAAHAFLEVSEWLTRRQAVHLATVVIRPGAALA
jgi:hypothetical protein